MDELLVSQPDTGEQALEITETLDPLRRHGLRRRGLGRGARAAGRDRGRDGRQLRRHPGPAHEPGPAQADRRREPLEHRPRLHQPAAREDRRHVRQPGDDARRPRAQVLRLGPAGHPPRRDDQDRHGVGRQPRPGQGRQEQGRRRRSASPSSTSCTARASPRRAASWTSASRWTSSPRPAPGSPSARPASARAARPPRSSSRPTRTSPPRSTAGSGPRSPRSQLPGRGHRRGRVAAGGSRHGRGPGPSRGRLRHRKPTPAERRERRSAVDDPAVVLDAGARFLEARPRSVAEVRRRLTTAGYRADLVEAAIEPPDRPRHTRRRRVRARLGGVARPGAAPRRARAPARARAEGRGPRDRGRGPRGPAGWPTATRTRPTDDPDDERRPAPTMPRPSDSCGASCRRSCAEADPAAPAPAGLRAARPQRLRAGRVLRGVAARAGRRGRGSGGRPDRIDEPSDPRQGSGRLERRGLG